MMQLAGFTFSRPKVVTGNIGDSYPGTLRREADAELVTFIDPSRADTFNSANF